MQAPRKIFKAGIYLSPWSCLAPINPVTALCLWKLCNLCVPQLLPTARWYPPCPVLQRYPLQMSTRLHLAVRRDPLRWQQNCDKIISSWFPRASPKNPKPTSIKHISHDALSPTRHENDIQRGAGQWASPPEHAAQLEEDIKHSFSYTTCTRLSSI